MNDELICILYVDDYPFDRALVRDALMNSETRFELIEASSRRQFEAFLHDHQYDLVLSDFNILGFTGLEVLDIVLKELPGTPVIIVTGTGSEEVAAEAIKRGAADYIIKSPAQIQRLPHIIQTALKTQRLRSERQRAQEALRESEQRYRIVSEITSDYAYGYEVLPNGELVIEWVTGALERITQHTQAELTSRGGWTALIHPDDHPVAEEQLNALMKGVANSIEYRIVTKSGEILWMEDQAQAVWDEKESRTTFIYGSVQDITERKRAEEALRKSEERFRQVYEHMEVGVARISMDFRIENANKAFCRMLGYDEDELIELNIGDIFHHEMIDESMRKQSLLITGEIERYRLEMQFIHKSGHPIHGILDANLIRDAQGQPSYLLGSVLDITERKSYERELFLQREELRILGARLAEAEESERRRLARELHDQVGQSLAVLGFTLNVLREQIGIDAGQTQADDAIVLVEEISQNIRAVMDDLRPSVLDDYGLFSALSWYSDRFSRQTGIEVKLLGRGLEPRLANPAENALFRIAQEALTNITRHAQANRVIISLKDNQGGIELVIKDDGSGFEETELGDGGQRLGWGLVNMRERAEAIGGVVIVETAIDRGTEVLVKVPRG